MTGCLSTVAHSRAKKVGLGLSLLYFTDEEID